LLKLDLPPPANNATNNKRVWLEAGMELAFPGSSPVVSATRLNSIAWSIAASTRLDPTATASFEQLSRVANKR